ncbi:MAG: SpoIID/LytB domain-containing protein [Vicinamibacteria bacterium]
MRLRILAVTVFTSFAADATGQEHARTPVASVAEDAFLKEREVLGGLSHASGTRPEFGRMPTARALSEVAPIIRVGLSPTLFTSSGTVSAEYDTSAAHNHPAVDLTGTSAFEILDEAGSLVGSYAASQIVHATALGGAVALSVGGATVAVVAGPVRAQPATGALLVVASMRRTNRLLPNSPMTAPAYRGFIEIRVSEADPQKLRCVNELGIEEYVAGVVVNESLNTFHVEALKAQAVTARGYALASRGRFSSRGFDIDDSTLSQVYRGQTSETPQAMEATLSTATLVATREGRIIQALYSSSMGGHTENNEFVFPAAPNYPGTNIDPALRGRHDSFGPLSFSLDDDADVAAFYTRVDPDAAEVSPATLQPLTSLHRWTRTRTIDELLARLKDGTRGWGVPASARSIRDIRTTIRGASGRPMQAIVSGDGWAAMITGWSDLRALATLSGQTPGGTTTASAPNSPSAMTLSRGLDGAVTAVTFVGGGFGHNVGMSQWGSQGRALRGQNFVEILKAYYAGIEVTPAFSGDPAVVALGSVGSR